ncbi:MAG: hypothetical protein IJV91_12995 [Kiritimatiellae bacterium]|nr:hypothetical protein [Kiritimatiellia bacterium]
MKKAAGPNSPTAKKGLRRKTVGQMKYIQKKRAITDAPMPLCFTCFVSSKRGMV